MRRQYRRDEARREARRALARAGRTEFRRRSRAAAHGPSTRAAYPCAFACADCLTMQWPKPPSNAHPHRTEPMMVGAPTEPCPQCGGSSWVDLAVPEHAEMLLAPHDGFERSRTRARASVTVSVILTGVVAVWLLNDLSGPVLAATLTVSVAWFLIRSIRAWWAVRMPPNALTLGQASRGGRQVVTAPIEAEDTVRAPLTGRACVAYHLRLSLRGDRRPRVDERRIVEASVGKVSIGPENGLDIRGPVESSTIDPSEPQMQRLLRERGLDPALGTWIGTESIVCAGDPATILERRTIRSLVA